MPRTTRTRLIRGLSYALAMVLAPLLVGMLLNSWWASLYVVLGVPVVVLVLLVDGSTRPVGDPLAAALVGPLVAWLGLLIFGPMLALLAAAGVAARRLAVAGVRHLRR